MCNVSMSFSYTVKSKKSIDEIVKELPKHLKEIGFGILGSLNFQKILTEKGEDFERPYQLLEVCNPKLAKQVLEFNPDLGLLLPCTIAVYKKKDGNHISLAKPSALLEIASEDNLKFMGEEIEKNLIKVIDKVK